jgi:hypothetical protein
MVPQDEINRPRERDTQLVEQGDQVRRLTDVSAQKNAIARHLRDRADESFDLIVVEKVQVDVGEPSKLHGIRLLNMPNTISIR